MSSSGNYTSYDNKNKNTPQPFERRVFQEFKKVGSAILHVLSIINSNNDLYGPEDGQFMGFNRYPHCRSKTRPPSTRELNSMRARNHSHYRQHKVAPI